MEGGEGKEKKQGVLIFPLPLLHQKVGDVDQEDDEADQTDGRVEDDIVLHANHYRYFP